MQTDCDVKMEFLCTMNLKISRSTAVEKNQGYNFKEDDLFSLLVLSHLAKYKRRREQKLNGMRYHPLVLKFSLGLYTKSKSCFFVVRNALDLPSEATIIAYKHGQACELTSACIEATILNKTKDIDSPKAILMIDAMSVTGDVLFCPATGKIEGVTEMQSVNKQIRSINNRSQALERCQATHMNFIMCHLVEVGFRVPIMIFCTSSITPDIVHRAMMSTIVRLAVQVIATVMDGTSENRGWQHIVAKLTLRDITELDEGEHHVAFPHPCHSKPVFIVSDPSLGEKGSQCSRII
eukprot:c7665_g1_i1.p1 GENE.c7665_g1_i1~~c7665_g1_i1.p1  ORF type:complete len:293 (-),score=63.24 c7665_g1_i1:809-1687(-)